MGLMGDLFGGSPQFEAPNIDLTLHEEQLLPIIMSAVQGQQGLGTQLTQAFLGQIPLTKGLLGQVIQGLQGSIPQGNAAVDKGLAAGGAAAAGGLAPGQAALNRNQAALGNVQNSLGTHLGGLMQQLSGADQRLDSVLARTQRLSNQLTSEIGRPQSASPQDLEFIRRAGSQAIDLGMSDLNRVRDENLAAIRDVVAPSRGLRPGDDPILQRFDDALGEHERGAADLITSIRQQGNEQALQYPLARRASDLAAAGYQQGTAQLSGSILGQQLGLGSNLFGQNLARTGQQANNLALQGNLLGQQQSFVNQLQQQALMNRLNIFGALGQLPFQTMTQGQNLAQVFGTSPTQALGAISSAQHGTPVNTSSPGLLPTVMQLAQSAGAGYNAYRQAGGGGMTGAI